MPDFIDQPALEMVLRTLPTDRDVVLTVNPDGTIDSAALGLNDGEVMLACWKATDVCRRISGIREGCFRRGQDSRRGNYADWQVGHQ